MSNISKKYFIVFDKISEKNNEWLFNINFFYIKSLKSRKRSSFSFINKPFLRGTVVFGPDIKDKLRPLQFNKNLDDGKAKPLDPRLFKKLLISNENQFIAFSKKISAQELFPMLDMLDNFQFDKEKIIDLIFCDSCLDDSVFTIINKGSQILSKGRSLCPKCALDVVLKQTRLSGLISGDRINPKFKNFFNHMILKFRNTEKVLSAFKANFNPSKNRDVTLYDIDKRSPISKKYLDFHIDDVDIQPELIKIYKNLGVSTLLPIQTMSIEGGLLSKRNNQLIMAPTSGGKTLVGELAGISRALSKKNDKMLYLVPIVALANVRTEEFRKKFKPLKLKVVKKIGESLLDKRDVDNLENLLNADVIIATYEAVDYVLRSGNSVFLGEVKTVVIDEIQTLIDPDRGFLLDGFIARLKTLFKDAQYLYLSATIGEPDVLAQKLNCQLIRYNNRPVPVERHLILCLNEKIKHRFIIKLVRSAFFKKSKYGFKGQSIIFTNARKKCESLTAHFQRAGLRVKSYHSGLTHAERKRIEKEFQQQKIAGVVATAALAAGVDFPASQVIFESLAMGINWLTVAEFEQMLGRAGRLKKHELGLAYILVEPGKVYSPKMKLTEENIVIKLLNGKIKDFELTPDENKCITELLAFISMFKQGVKKDKIYFYYESIINNEYDIEGSLKRLISLKTVSLAENIYKITKLGHSIAKSFLTLDESIDIIKSLRSKSKTIMEIVLDLKPLRNVYISKDIVADLSRNVNMKYFSNNFFSASSLNLMNSEYVKKRKKFSQGFIDLVLKWTSEIFTCSCKENPYCECGRLNLEKIILELRTEDNFSIEEISDFLENEYKIVIFKGDLINFLENLIYSFESIRNITKSIPNLDNQYINEILEIPKIIDKIKN